MIFIDKVPRLYKDLREYCEDKASEPGASYVWAQYVELLDADIKRAEKSLQAYFAEADGDESPTWFERIKGCETPEEMAALIHGVNPFFCRYGEKPLSCVYQICPDCCNCIALWLREKVKS